MVLEYLDAIPPLVVKKLAYVFIFYLLHLSLFLAVYVRPTSPRIKQMLHKLATEKDVRRDPRIVRQELATRLVAVVHATIITYVAVYYLVNDEILRIRSWTDWPKFYTTSDSFAIWCCFSFAYFICDVIMCTILFKENGLPFFVHSIVGAVGTAYGAFGYGHIYVAVIFLWEASTPMVHLRWFLMEYGYKKSRLYMINGIVLVLVFIFFRIIIGIPVCARLFYDLNIREGGEVISLAPRITFTISAASATVLNLTWASKLISGAIKTVRGGSSSHEKNE